MKTTHQFHFRWPVRQLDPMTVEMTVERGEGPGILNMEFCRDMGLSDGEVDAAENAVIREIAIID